MSGYVPGYFTNVARQADGWPVGVTDDEKRTLTSHVQGLLERVGGPLPLSVIVRRFRDSERTQEILRARGGALWDTIYAIVHRSLLAAGAEEVWQKGQP